jgi:hypothetical protein
MEEQARHMIRTDCLILLFMPGGFLSCWFAVLFRPWTEYEKLLDITVKVFCIEAENSASKKKEQRLLLFYNFLHLVPRDM